MRGSWFRVALAGLVFTLCVSVGVYSTAQAGGVGGFTAGSSWTVADDAAYEGAVVENGLMRTPLLGQIGVVAFMAASVYMAFQPPTNLTGTRTSSTGYLASLVASGADASTLCKQVTVPTTATVTSWGVYSLTGSPRSISVEYGFIQWTTGSGSSAKTIACVTGASQYGGTYAYQPVSGSGTGGLYMQITVSGIPNGSNPPTSVTNQSFSASGLANQATPIWSYSVAPGAVFPVISWALGSPFPAGTQPGYEVQSGWQDNSHSGTCFGPPPASGSSGSGVCSQNITYPASTPTFVPYANPTGYHEVVDCHDYGGTGNTPDQMVTYDWSLSENVISPATCGTLAPPADGGVWAPAKVTVTTVGQDGPSPIDTETFPAPTGHAAPAPGPAGQTVTGIIPNPDPSKPPIVTTDPTQVPDPSADPSPDPTPTPSPDPNWDPCSHVVDSFDPVNWVVHGTECALDWAFVPKSPPSFSDVPSPLPPGWVPSVTQIDVGACGAIDLPSISLGPLLEATGAHQLVNTCDSPWPLVRDCTYYGVLAVLLMSCANRAFKLVMEGLGMATDYVNYPTSFWMEG